MEKRKKEKKRTEKEKLLPANRFLMKQKAINKKVGFSFYKGKKLPKFFISEKKSKFALI